MQLIVALGGIVGDDQKLIAIPFDAIQISADGDELHTSRTRDQLAGLAPVTLDAQTRESRSRTARRRRRVALGRTREPPGPPARPARHRCASDASATSWEPTSSAAAATRSAKSTTSFYLDRGCRQRSRGAPSRRHRRHRREAYLAAIHELTVERGDDERAHAARRAGHRSARAPAGVRVRGSDHRAVRRADRGSPRSALRWARDASAGDDDMSTAKLTTDHATIRRWAEARKGKPARVHSTGDTRRRQPAANRFSQEQRRRERVSRSSAGTSSSRNSTTSALPSFIRSALRPVREAASTDSSAADARGRLAPDTRHRGYARPGAHAAAARGASRAACIAAGSRMARHQRARRLRGGHDWRSAFAPLSRHPHRGIAAAARATAHADATSTRSCYVDGVRAGHLTRADSRGYGARAPHRVQARGRPAGLAL